MSVERIKLSAAAASFFTPCTPDDGMMSRRVKPLSVILLVLVRGNVFVPTIDGCPGGGVRGREPTEPVAHEPDRGLAPLVIVG